MHTPVMVEEVLDYLNPRPGGVYVDCTLGTGGHSLAILEKTGGSIKLIGIDWDQEAIRVSEERLKKYKNSLILARENFARIARILQDKNVQRVDGFLYDLGLCSHHLNQASRGFSFHKDAPLDMRMDRRKKMTAAHIVNRFSKGEIENILHKLGEERWAKRMAQFIVEERKKSSISTTKDLVQVLKRAVPAKFRKGRRVHFATRAFQGLRIAVNEELENLKRSLSVAIDLLSPEGRLCVISYHSLEDKIVKRMFRKVEGKELTVLTSKVVKPTSEEVKDNPRGRSARLRAAQRL